jgi:uncharacterized protein with HEPN domain
MTSSRDYSDSLNDILDAIQKIQKFVEGVDYESFRANDEKSFAVIRALEIIGEATKQIPIPLRQKYPLIPWNAIAGMRDKLIHGYFVISLPRVWETVQRDLPVLKETIQLMLTDLEDKK